MIERCYFCLTLYFSPQKVLHYATLITGSPGNENRRYLLTLIPKLYDKIYVEIFQSIFILLDKISLYC